MLFTDEQIAKIAHDANCALEDVLRDPCPSVTWTNEPQEIRQRVLEMVRAARNGATPRDIHELWRKDLESKGWTWGAEKDWGAQTHPWLLPYESLPDEQRVKDRMFLYIVTALAVGS